MKIVCTKCFCIGFIFLFFLISAQAYADVNQFAGYVGISTIGPFNTVEVAGNVGIGSTSPGEALDVQGTIRTTTISATTYVNSLSFITSASPSAASSFTINGLDTTHTYKLILNLLQNTSNGMIYIQFNNDAGSNYQWSGSAVDGPSFDGGVATGTTSINTTIFNSYATGTRLMEITFSTVSTNDVKAFGIMSDDSNVNSGTAILDTFAGRYNGSANLSSITIGCTAGTMTGTAKLYAYN